MTSSCARLRGCSPSAASTARRWGTSPRRWGCRKGSLYSLTASKQALLADAMREGAAAFHAALDGIPDDERAVERIRGALRAHLHVVAGQLDVATVFIREWRYVEGPERAGFVAERRRYEQRWRALFREGSRARRAPRGRRRRGRDAARPVGRQLGLHVAAGGRGHGRARRSLHRARSSTVSAGTRRPRPSRGIDRRTRLARLRLPSRFVSGLLIVNPSASGVTEERLAAVRAALAVRDGGRAHDAAGRRHGAGAGATSARSTRSTCSAGTAPSTRC